jgi:hypothetical protein
MEGRRRVEVRARAGDNAGAAHVRPIATRVDRIVRVTVTWAGVRNHGELEAPVIHDLSARLLPCRESSTKAQAPIGLRILMDASSSSRLECYSGFDAGRASSFASMRWVNVVARGACLRRADRPTAPPRRAVDPGKTCREEREGGGFGRAGHLERRDGDRTVAEADTRVGNLCGTRVVRAAATADQRAVSTGIAAAPTPTPAAIACTAATEAAAGCIHTAAVLNAAVQLIRPILATRAIPRVIGAIGVEASATGPGGTSAGGTALAQATRLR